MISCIQCEEKPAASSFALCVDCIRNYPNRDRLAKLHAPVRERFNLPAKPPGTAGGIACNVCANNCIMGPGESGYCGLRQNKDGRLRNRMAKGTALVRTYLDLLPTNCCAAWFCRGSKEQGYNLAVFFYGCSFDCIYCQNAEHKLVESAPVVSEEDLVKRALDSRVRCVCFFGGSPEPQLPFALRTARRILEETGSSKHICWEWNGSGNPELVKKAVELSKKSGGTVKFDLKAFHPHVHLALCGVDNSPTLKNFAVAAEMFPENDHITATTLLVPYYVDSHEVGSIASFISNINPQIPYSLLVFHPDFYLDDLPITPRKQVYECYDRARQYLKRVYIGNRELL